MDETTIQRYQPGGDIYAKLAAQYGATKANAIAVAALTGDHTAINAAIVRAKYGADKNTNTAKIFVDQILTDPLAAPLENVNSVLANTIKSIFKNPWVLFSAGLIVIYLFGGFDWLKRRIART
jgi:hypothetical protein